MSTPTQTDPWWTYTVGTAAALRSGKEPPATAVHGPLLEPGEVARLSSPAIYSRLTSGDGNFHRAQAPFMVNPALMAAAMAGQAAINSRRRRDAERGSQPQWTNHRQTAVLTTNQRLMCSRPDHGWVSFWYSEMTEFHPDPHRRLLTMSFTDDHTPPLQLAGPAAPAVALWVGHSLYDDRWHEDPRLAALLPTRDPRHATITEHAVHNDGLTAEQQAWWDDHRPAPTRHPRSASHGLDL